MYDGTITASSGRGEGATKVTLKDPCYEAGMKLKDWVKVYGEDIVLSHFLASRTIAIQKPMQSVLKSETGTVEQALEAGSAKAKDLKASTRTGARKTARKTREEVTADFKKAGLNVDSPEVQEVIDGLFNK